jgi:hypothetical protein
MFVEESIGDVGVRNCGKLQECVNFELQHSKASEITVIVWEKEG